MNIRSFSLVLNGILLFVLVTLGASFATEAVFPIACYKGEELQQLKEWEKQWAGKKIDHSNIDGVKEYMPESYYNVIKEPDKWGEFWFEIVPYRQIKPTKGVLEATLKYAGNCNVDDKKELQNWVAGFPFPSPTTALEVAYNFDSLTKGDTRYIKNKAKTVDGKRNTERNVSFENWVMEFYGRCDVPPVPEVPHNNKGIRRGVHGTFHEPLALKGNRSVSIKWIDPSREYAAWTFSAGTRRIMRRSTAYRYDHEGGSDISREDQDVYNYQISRNTYKLLGRKDILLGRHNDHVAQFANHREGYCFDSGEKRERINTYVLEVVSKDPNYLYSKSVWYIDPESWFILYADKYDLEGKLWKIQQVPTSMIKIENTGEYAPQLPYINMCDVQRRHSTPGANLIHRAGVTGEFWDPSYYHPKALKKYGY